MPDERHDVLVVLRRHFDPSFVMLERLVACCPDDLWVKDCGGCPFWQRIYHTLEGIDFWFRIEGGEYELPDFGKDVTPDLDCRSNDHLARNELRDYLEKMKRKAEVFFRVNHDRMFEPSVIHDGMTNCDVIMAQIRHIQYHVGDCNSILGLYNTGAVEWLGYGEP